MLTAFYVLVAVCTVFVVLSLQIVRAHEKKCAAEKSDGDDLNSRPEEEFFTSPIYKVMEVVAHL